MWREFLLSLTSLVLLKDKLLMSPSAFGNLILGST